MQIIIIVIKGARRLACRIMPCFNSERKEVEPQAESSLWLSQSDGRKKELAKEGLAHGCGSEAIDT